MGGFPIARIFRTDVYATPNFLLLLGLYFLLHGSNVAAAAIFSFAVVVSLLVHEFGHVFAVRWTLGSESRVVLWGLGGLCIHEPARRPLHGVIISMMGPLFGLVLGGAAWFARGALPLEGFFWSYLIDSLVWIGFIWTAVNLLPILPLDGGQALLWALRARLDSYRAGRIVARLSVGTAAAGAVFAFYYGYPLGAVLGVLLVLQNLTAAGRGI